MGEHERFLTGVADDIALWQGGALRLPLPEIREISTECMNDLARSLNAFNKAYVTWAAKPHENQEEPDAAVVCAAARVISHALSAAVFTLGLYQRCGRRTPERN